MNKYRIVYDPSCYFKYTVYYDRELIDVFQTMWGAKRFIKKTIKLQNKVNLYNSKAGL